MLSAKYHDTLCHICHGLHRFLSFLGSWLVMAEDSAFSPCPTPVGPAILRVMGCPSTLYMSLQCIMWTDPKESGFFPPYMATSCKGALWDTWLCPHTFSHHYFSIKGPVLTAAVSLQADVNCDRSLNLKTKLFLWTIVWLCLCWEYYKP